MRQCSCGTIYILTPGKPGRINECFDCGAATEEQLGVVPYRAGEVRGTTPEEIDASDFPIEKSGYVMRREMLVER